MPDVNGIASDRLRSFVERIERLNEDIKGLQGDRKEVFQEAKSQGFDQAIMKLLIRRRGKSKDDLDEEDSMLLRYEAALGGWDGTPLGDFAKADE